MKRVARPNAKLKPCPFCGKTIRMTISDNGLWNFFCDNEGCGILMMTMTWNNRRSQKEMTKGQAIKNWNHRILDGQKKKKAKRKPRKDGN